ncbi:MAG: hypothetical protein E7158_02260 [Firmicutes bacterium]|nr:hypothetical protein [Bacillota bacterium]
MILRKPYKFLIKHFKIIHILLCLPVLYLLIKSNNLFSFFNSYISNSYSYETISNLAGSYINLFMYLSILIIVGISLTVYYLMKQKEKPTKLYVAYIVYYLILFVIFTFFHNVLSDMERNDLAASTSRAYRDITLLLTFPQYFFIFYSAFRGFGFDIKSFRFELDLKDLDISDEDNEEFEFVLGVETYKYKRTIRRFIREFKYYILENKFVFSVLSAVFILVLTTTLYMHFNVYNKSYTKNHKFSHNAFTMNVLDTMITNMDYNGKTITKDKYYLVLQVRIDNNSITNVELDTDNFRLQIDDGYLVPTLDRSEYFVDFGKSYNGGKISQGTSGIYNLVYELNKKQIKKNYKIKILENIEYKIGDLTAHYKILNIRPKKILDINNRGKYKLKEKISLDDSLLNDSQVVINSYEITDNYYYTYELCSTKNNCRELNDVVSIGYGNSKVKTTLLVLDVDTKIDKESVYYNAIQNMNEFYENFFTIEYDGIESTTKNVTPSNLKNKIVLVVPENIINSNKLNLLLTIRNQKYIVNLK